MTAFIITLWKSGIIHAALFQYYTLYFIIKNTVIAVDIAGLAPKRETSQCTDK